MAPSQSKEEKAGLRPVILAEGVGKRLWPLSTEKKPKQFQVLTQGDLFPGDPSKSGETPVFTTYSNLRRQTFSFGPDGQLNEIRMTASFILEPIPYVIYCYRDWYCGGGKRRNGKNADEKAFRS